MLKQALSRMDVAIHLSEYFYEITRVCTDVTTTRDSFELYRKVNWRNDIFFTVPSKNLGGETMSLLNPSCNRDVECVRRGNSSLSNWQDLIVHIALKIPELLPFSYVI